MSQRSKYILALRILHGVLTIYFTLCLFYLYIVGITGNVNAAIFTVSIFSLAIEGIAVFALNNGNCPLIHIQRKIGDNTPFFELFLPPKLAKQAIPVFALLTVIAVFIILIRFVISEVGTIKT